MTIKSQNGATLFELLLSVAILGVVTAIIFPLFITNFYKHFEIQDAIAEMQQQGRFTGDLISREIRQAGYDPTGTIFVPGNTATIGKPYNNCNKVNALIAPILEARPTVFHFLANLNGEAGVGDSNEHIRYEWVDSTGFTVWESCPNKPANTKKIPHTLYRTSGGGGMQPTSSNIQDLIFEYFDEDENPIQNGNDSLMQDQRARIRKVVLTVIARTDRSDPDYRDDEGALKNGGYRTRTFIYEIWLRNM